MFTSQVEIYNWAQTCAFLNASFYNPKQKLLRFTQMVSTQSMHLIKIFIILNCKLKILEQTKSSQKHATIHFQLLTQKCNTVFPIIH